LKQRGLKFGGTNALSSQVTCISQKIGEDVTDPEPDDVGYADAELRVLSECSIEALWVIKLQRLFNIPCSPVLICGDSEGAYDFIKGTFFFGPAQV